MLLLTTYSSQLRYVICEWPLNEYICFYSINRYCTAKGCYLIYKNLQCMMSLENTNYLIQQRNGFLYFTELGHNMAPGSYNLRVLTILKFTGHYYFRKTDIQQGLWKQAHMWLLGSPNPYKIQESWECSFQRSFQSLDSK